MKKYLSILAPVSLIASTGAIALADGKEPHADVEIRTADGRLVTGTLVDGAFVRERVFGSDFGEVVPNITDEPGFDAADGTLTPGTLLGFNIMDAVRVWNGSDFSTVSDSTMTLSFLTLETTSSTTPGQMVNGFNFLVDANGGMHDHPAFILNSPATDGVYLLELQFTGGGFADSDSFWIVFNQNLDESIHDAAIDYVREFIVPAPGAAGALALAGVAFARRRRAN
jgi:hypothetical protein